MAKYYGGIGYYESKETEPGVWTKVIVEKNYSGDVIRNTRRWQNTDSINDNLSISNTISILADPFAYLNFQNIAYVKWMGTPWKVDSVEIQRPRLILSLGGIYNED